MAMPNLKFNVEDNVVFLGLKVFNSNYSYLITAVLNASEKVVKVVIVNQTLPSFLGGSLEYMHTVPLISRIF